MPVASLLAEGAQEEGTEAYGGTGEGEAEELVPLHGKRIDSGIENISPWVISLRTGIGYDAGMVRPESRIVLTGASPVRVSAEAPGSRLQPGGEIRPSQAECQKPLQEREANQRAATRVNASSHVILSAERRLGGPSRSCRGEGNRQHSGSERVLDLSGVVSGGTLGKSHAEQERSYLAAKSGKDRRYKAGQPKADGAGRKSEGFVVPRKACSKTRRREGALL